MRPARSLAGAAGIVWLLALGASAQGASPTPPRKGRFQVGPLWLTPRLLVRSAGVDDNVYLSSSAPVSDRQAVVAPSLDALLPVGSRLRLSATGSLGLNYFERQTSERSTDLGVSSRAEIDAGPFTLHAVAGASRARQRFSVELDERLERRSHQLGGGLRLRATQRLALGAQVQRQRQRFEDGLLRGDSVRSALERDVTLYTADASLALTARTNLVAAVEVFDERFVAQVSPGPDEAHSRRYTAGFSFGLGALLSGSVRAGVRDYPDRTDQAAPSYRGLVLAVDTALPVGERARLALRAARDVSYAVARAAGPDGPRRNSAVTGLYGGTLTVELPFSLVGRGLLSFERADYVLPYLQGGRESERSDRVRSYGATLLRAFGPSLRAGGTLERARRTSTLGDFGYERTSYGLTLEYTP